MVLVVIDRARYDAEFFRMVAPQKRLKRSFFEILKIELPLHVAISFFSSRKTMRVLQIFTQVITANFWCKLLGDKKSAFKSRKIAKSLILKLELGDIILFLIVLIWFSKKFIRHFV